nr:zinc-binding dehydrogenase [Micromonospora sp. DSM 115978]
MKAVRGAEGGVNVVDLDEPPGFGELLQVKSASVCSSDFLYIGYGSRRVLGHELAGIREDGSAVIVEALFGCLECEQCLQGRYNLCPVHPTRALGITADGGMAEQFRAPATSFVALPAGLDVRDASVVEPASVSWHALRLAETGPDTRVAVVGAGALGLLAVAGARRQGATDVAVAARHPHQVEAAERLGAKVTPDGLYDVVVEAAGTAESLARAIDLVGPRGIVVTVGVHVGKVEVDWNTLFSREARVVPSRGYCRHGERREMEEAAAMLAEDPDVVAALVTHRFPIEDAVEAFRVARDKSSGAIRVVIEP